MNLGAKVFDHEVLMGEVLPEFLPKMRLGMLGHPYAIWPGTSLARRIQTNDNNGNC